MATKRPQERKDDLFTTFGGDPERAQTRLRGLAEEACKTLPVERLNLLNQYLALVIDDTLGQLHCRSAIFEHELKAEQEKMKNDLRHMEKQFR